MRYLTFVLFLFGISCQEKQVVTSEINTGTTNEAQQMSRYDSCDCQPGEGGEFDILLSHTTMRDFSDDFLIFFSESELRIMRNSIYAFKGLKFSSKDLNDYFCSQPWYCPKYDNVDSSLSLLEIENLAFIKSFEARRDFDTIDKHQYFLNLFATKETIPLYFQKYYLDITLYGYQCIADRLFRHTKNYDVIIYYTHLFPVPDDDEDQIKIITIDKSGKILSSEDLYEGYQVLNENELVSTNEIWDYSRDELLEPIAKIKYHYNIKPNGKIIRKEI